MCVYNNIYITCMCVCNTHGYVYNNIYIMCVCIKHMCVYNNIYITCVCIYKVLECQLQHQ